jgi:hypothetical protein
VRELQALERKIKLPVQSDDGPKIKLPIPLKVSFPVLVLNRNQPEEAAFVRMLLATEDRLLDMKGPILFPIFGRGRVLGGLTGKEIDGEMLVRVAAFLCKECSCQVKELNPGIDLLMSLHWNDAFDRMYEGKEAVPMPASSPAYLSPAAPKNEVVPAKKSTSNQRQWDPAPLEPQIAPNVAVLAPAEEPLDEPKAPQRFALWIGMGAVSGLVLLSGGWLFNQAFR